MSVKEAALGIPEKSSRRRRSRRGSDMEEMDGNGSILMS